MTTITLKIDKRTKAGKAFMAMSESFFKNVEGIEIIENTTEKVAFENDLPEQNSYNPEFVKKILKAKKQIKQGKTTLVNTNDIWGSLGLK